jgi:hypothetical protein
VIDGHQNQTQIALVELVEELLECSWLVTVHTVDVLNQVCIQSFVVVLFSLTSNTISINKCTNLVVELVLEGSIHQPILVGSKLMVTSTLQLHRREVMVVVGEL